MELPSGMRLEGGVGKVPFSLFLSNLAFLFVSGHTHTHTHTHTASNLKNSLSNCPKLFMVIFLSLRSQDVWVLAWFLLFSFWNPVPFLKIQVCFLSASSAWLSSHLVLVFSLSF
jgi:hypothetical protein